MAARSSVGGCGYGGVDMGLSHKTSDSASFFHL